MSGEGETAGGRGGGAGASAVPASTSCAAHVLLTLLNLIHRVAQHLNVHNLCVSRDLHIKTNE